LAHLNDEAAAPAGVLVTRVRVTHQIQAAQALLRLLHLLVAAFQARLRHQVVAQVQRPQQVVAQQYHYRRTVKRLKIP